MGEGPIAGFPSRCLAGGHDRRPRPLWLPAVACLAIVGCALDRAPLAGQGRTNGGALIDEGTSGVSGMGMPFPPGSTGGTGGISMPPGTDAGELPGFEPDGGAVTGDAAASTSDASLDGSTVHAVAAPGAPCMTDTDCSSAGVERTCFTEEAFAPLLVLPGGYCSQLCDSSLGCEPGATCVLIPVGSFPLFFCMEACTTDADCRVAEGYTCNMALSDTPVCSLP